MMVWSYQLEITVCCFWMKFTDWVNCVRITNFWYIYFLSN